MLRIVLALIGVFLLNQNAFATTPQVQFFPPQGPCSPDKPILAWNGSGSTYCTSLPTANLPDCTDGQFLTKKNGTLVCSDVTGKNVTTPVVTQTPPTVIKQTIVQPVVNACPTVTVPSCSADYVLVDYGLDTNGCQISPQCQYIGPSYVSAPVYVAPVVDTYVEVPYVEPYIEDVHYEETVTSPCYECEY